MEGEQIIQELETVEEPLKKHYVWGGVVFPVVLAVGYLIYFVGFFNTTDSEQDITQVTVSPKWVNQAQFAGIFVAKDKEIYEKNGLEVLIDPFESGDSVLTDLKNGTSQFGLMSANEFLSHFSKGEPIKAIAAFYQVSPYIVASFKKDDITSPVQFKGKRLAVKGGNGAEALTVFDLLLSSAGLNSDDIESVYLPLGQSEYEDLVQDKADVVGFYRTRLYQFDKDGASYNVIYPEQYGAALYNDVLIVTDEFLDEHPDTVRSFVKATVDGWNYAYDHQEEAVAITLRYVTEESYKDIEYEKYILSSSESLMRPDPKSKIGAMEFERWEKFYEALSSRNFLQSKFDVRDSFTTDFLP